MNHENLSWVKAIAADGLPVIPSRFDLDVEQLGIADNPEEWAASAELREWARVNRNSFYVPENFLSDWR